MAIEKMRLLRLSGSKENIERIIEAVFSAHVMQAELASVVPNDEGSGDQHPVDDVFAQYLIRIERIQHSLQIGISDESDEETTFTEQEIEAHLHEIESTLGIDEISAMKPTYLSKDDHLALAKLHDINLSAIDRNAYVFGKIPVRNLTKLPLHKDNQYDATILMKNAQFVWVIYKPLDQYKSEGDKLLARLNFKPIAMPKFDEKELSYEFKSMLGKIYGYVKSIADARKSYKYIQVSDNTYVITGYVPQNRVVKFKAMVSEIADIVIQDTPAELGKGLEPPTILNNNWFARPFELFVELYGLPHYGEFDPTFYVAFTYSLLFGIMFGDLGQGFVLVIIGWLLYRKTKGKLWGIVERLGFFSMFFGIIYGSVFGNEHLLNPLYQAVGFAEKPIEVMRSDFTTPLLLMAVGLGAALILTSMVINIVLQLRRKNVGDALFSQNGLAGVVFYGSLIIGAALQIGLKIPVANPFTIGLFIVVPLVIILFRVPLKNLIRRARVTPHEGWGGYMSESIFELLEVLLSFMSNTMSFLRVGGFVLSHAGMMVVVMKLTEMTGNFGIVTLIIGNIFVIGLEGLIVGIQTLRLEFYEMFSRYFEGGGKKYVPTTL